MKNLFLGRTALCSMVIALLVGSSFAEKSMWQKFKDFFTPGESLDCSGPVCDEIRTLDTRISKVEGRYTRERRPTNKARFKAELDSLNGVRDSLMVVLNSQNPSSSSVETATEKPEVAPVAAEIALAKCAPDTVFVHDTLVVHDTLYVVLANKPEAAPAAAPADSTNPADSTAPAAN